MVVVVCFYIYDGDVDDDYESSDDNGGDNENRDEYDVDWQLVATRKKCDNGRNKLIMRRQIWWT